MKPTIETALSEVTNQPSGLDYAEKKVIWPKTNSGEAPTWQELESKLIQLENDYEKQAYARSRADTYPSFGDQLDYIFHHGIEKWKTDIVQPVKDKFPKP